MSGGLGLGVSVSQGRIWAGGSVGANTGGTLENIPQGGVTREWPWTGPSRAQRSEPGAH